MRMFEGVHIDRKWAYYGSLAAALGVSYIAYTKFMNEFVPYEASSWVFTGII